jgi:arsenate reductase (thioredoxin)
MSIDIDILTFHRHVVNRRHIEESVMTTPLKVLFICKGNHARSIMAEAITTKLAPQKVQAFSAGSQPQEAINPFAVRLLTAQHHDISGLRTKSWLDFAKPDAPPMDFVFTLSETAANEPAPAWPGAPVTALWTLPDPAEAVGDDAQKALAFADAYRMLHNRIAIFTNLPMATLEGMALKHRLDTIGKDQTRSDIALEGHAA